MDANLTPTQSTCRAPGLPICDTESSTSEEALVPYRKIEPPKPTKIIMYDCIFGRDDDIDNYGSEEQDEEQNEEQSEEQSTVVEEELQLEDILDELKKKKERVDQIDQRYSLDTPDCPAVDGCVDMQLELNQFNTHPEILELQRNNAKLQQQLRSVQLCTKATNASVKNLRQRLCRDLESAVALQRRIAELDSFKRTMEHEQALCRQRYCQLLEDKYEWIDCYAYIKKKKEEGAKNLVKFVPRVEYTELKGEAIKFLNHGKLHSKSLYDFLKQTAARTSEEMKLRTSNRSELGTGLRINSDIGAFLQRNQHLFNKQQH